jgi:hypothetical protein
MPLPLGMLVGPCCFFFSFFAQRTITVSMSHVPGPGFGDSRPHALHSVLGPFGPLRHSGESKVPQSVHTYSSAILSFFFLSEEFLPSRSSDICMPASPRIRFGLASPVLIPCERSPSLYRRPVNISIVSRWFAPSYRIILSLILSGLLAARASSRFWRVRAVFEMTGLAGGGIWA